MNKSYLLDERTYLHNEKYCAATKFQRLLKYIKMESYLHISRQIIKQNYHDIYLRKGQIISFGLSFCAGFRGRIATKNADTVK